MSWAPRTCEPIVLNVNAFDGAEIFESELLATGVQSAKCSIETTAASGPTPPASQSSAASPMMRLTASLNDEQRRSRHNANERRRTNALKVSEVVPTLLLV